MTNHRYLSLLAALLLASASVAADQTRTVRPGETTERQLPGDQQPREWSLDANQRDEIKRVKVCRIQDVCKMRFKEGQTPRTRVRNLVGPLRYESDTTPISEAFSRQVRQALDGLRDRRGVTVRFIGYTDDAPLTGRDEVIHGDHVSLSKAQAQRVALAMQQTLGLPATAVESDGRGSARPVASNETAQGRSLNRRVEVEFWYDDPLEQLSEEPQLCPGDTDEVVTRVYEPAWGTIPALALRDGQAVVPAGFAATLRRALGEVAGRANPRVRFVGYTRNERLDRRTASVYGDDVGLSASRARRAMDAVMKEPELAGARAEHEGRGYVQSDDVVNTGFTQGDDSFVRVQVVYDEKLALDNFDGVEITRLTQDLRPKTPYELNVMHITVDGTPIDDKDRSFSDVERCTDAALDAANIRFHFDSLDAKPRLAVAADPAAVAVSDTGAPAGRVRFRMYSNYPSVIARAEVRIFDQPQSDQAVPLAVVAVDPAGLAEWQPTPEMLNAPTRDLKYLVRAYDANGAFDETETRPLWLYRESSATAPPAAADASSRALLAVYGESILNRQRIPVRGGTISVQGGTIPAGYTVWVAGRQIPVDANGNFVAEEILPPGTHTVEVAVLDAAGNGSLYLRDLQLETRELFYVGIADVTVSENRTSGPINLFQGTNVPQPFDSTVNGRLAFYMNGQVSDTWRLTASADTREGPVKDLFSNFLNKSPDSLFRRIDPDYQYPTFGDDGVVEEMAPTLGKFYVKASRGQSYGLWGNFKVGYLANELAHVDRGLYGANARYKSGAATKFGEQRAALDGFAAEPGTVPSYEEFRGTGGSIYFLRHQNILTGSERVRIELRDKDSGIVTGVVNLRYGSEYDVDYLQGRLLLTEPLSSTADDNQLVRSTGLSGNQAYLVVRYEYAPGFEKLDALAVGGQGHYWLNDYVRVGMTANTNSGDDADSNLGGADVTVRKSADSWFKLQGARSHGLLSRAFRSDDGGFGFSAPGDVSFTDADASAYRADVSVGLGDVFHREGGRATFYTQTLQAGYSAPGQATTKDTDFYGGTFRMPLTGRLSLAAKGDQRSEQQGLETRAIEVDAIYKVSPRWSLSGGARHDRREDRSPIVPVTQFQGERTDAVAQVMFEPAAQWRAYGFVQDTVASTRGRESNGRVGVGGSFRPAKIFKVDGEVSDGDLGVGGKLGTTLLYAEGSSLYFNYALENERGDDGRLRRGNLVSGAKTRLSDSSSVYLEERYQSRGLLTGLTHATGVQLVPVKHWNVGASAEVGTLRDSHTGAATDRKAGGIRLGYGAAATQWSTDVEYRRDIAQSAGQFGVAANERTTWLFRNNVRFNVTPDWRIIGKLNHSFSDSSLGDFYGGGYTEAVVGYAYRPVRHDRLNGLAKYTYFYNVPTTGQVSLQGTAAEFIQKSHIAAIDLTYDLTRHWSIGGKYAYRLGQVSLDRAQQTFFDNTAHLAVLRGDWRFRNGWESVIEARLLDLPDISERRTGTLVGIYRYLGKNFKVGTGYNFTDCSDDLTDLRYRHQGAFINVIGSM